MTFTEKQSGSLSYMISPHITARHAFTTRYGGVSGGAFTSLNLGLNRGDEPGNVRENYKNICRELGISPQDIVCSQQVHGTEIRAVTSADRGKLFTPEPREADGLVTSEPEVALAVFTADCVPVLLHDPHSRVIGAVHAGWRGTAAGIVCGAVMKMRTEYGCEPGDIRAAIGPCISSCCFETGYEVAEAVRNILGADAERFIVPRGGKFMVDLKGINRLLLMREGVPEEYIAVSGECTSCRCDKYWSHRRTNGVRGSQAAIIVMRGKE